MSGDIPYALLALLFSMIFSGAEIAFLSTNKLQLELQAREGSVIGKIMYFFSNQPGIFFCATLLGSLLSLIFFIFLSIRVLTYFDPDLASGIHHISSLAILIASTTFIIILVTYMIPKCFAIISPARVMNVVTIPFALCYIILFPFTFLIIRLLRFLSKALFRVDYPENRPLFRVTQWHATAAGPTVEQKPNSSLDQQVEHHASEFKTVKIRDCMVPRTEITAVEVAEGVELLKKAFVESGHSKIIVFRKTIDDIVGYCHSSSLFQKATTIQEIITPIITAPETTPANELMLRFIQEKKNVAVVMDEFGGTAGIVSMEDIIEEVFGEHAPEPDEEDLIEKVIDENTFIFSGRLEIEFLNEHYALHLPQGDYDTLAGLILAQSEHMPAVGETVYADRFRFVILASQNNRIEVVKVTREPASPKDLPPADEPL